MNDNYMEVLSKGRYEESEKRVYSPSTTPDTMSQSMSLTRLSSAEPYFVLNDDDSRLDQRNEHSVSACGTGEPSECKSTSHHAATEANLAGKRTVEQTGEDETAGESNFYSWVKSRTGSMETLLKSYISSHYGLRSAGRHVEDVTEEEKEGEEQQDEGENIADGEDSGSFSNDSSEGDFMEDALLPSVAKNSSGCVGLADQGTQRFTDPTTQRAYEKMLALDKRLMKVVRREKKVKRQRRQLEERMKEEGINLALMDGLSIGTNSRSCISPLFPTQPSETSDGTVRRGGVACEVTENSQDKHSSKDGGTESQEETKKKKKTKKGASQEYTGTDFIQRNIELVADAGSLVKMTNAEKQRLKELMNDSDDETASEGKDAGESDSHTVINSVQPIPEIMDRPFAMDIVSLERLGEIHSKLEAISATKIGVICYSPSSTASTPMAASKPESTFVSENTFEGTGCLSTLEARGSEQEGTVCKSDDDDDNDDDGDDNDGDDKGGGNGGVGEGTQRKRDKSRNGDEGRSSQCDQKSEKDVNSDASSTYDEGDVVLISLETASKEDQAASIVDGGSYDDHAGSICISQIEDSTTDSTRHHFANEVEAVVPDKGLMGLHESTSTSDCEWLPGFSGQGVLAKDCLSMAERERMNLLDEKLQQLKEESDSDYLSKKPLSSEQLKLLLEQCKDTEDKY